MSEYQEFVGKSVEEALRLACEAFGAQRLDDLDFEILTPGSRGVLGMGAEPARIVAAPRDALGSNAPRREAAGAAEAAAPPKEAHTGGRPRERGRLEGHGGPPGGRGPGRAEHAGPPRGDRGGRREGPPRTARNERPAARREAGAALSAGELEQVAAARASLSSEREELQAAEASPEALAAGKEILETLLEHLGFDAVVEVHAGETSKLNVTGQGAEKEALGALIGRKGERLSALQHLVNLLLSRRMGGWTRVLVDVEDYRGRRERQLREIALRAAGRVMETGKMLQLEPMPALERRWIHLALRDHTGVSTQSIGEEPNRRVVLYRRTD